jgi:hypothetical protein
MLEKLSSLLFFVRKKSSSKFALYKTVAAAVLTLTLFSQGGAAYAAALTSLSDTQTSVKINALSDHTIQFVTPTGIAAGANVTVTFPAGFVMGTSTLLNVDFATSTTGTCSGFNQETLALSPSNGTWGYSTSSQTLTFTSGTGVVPPNRCIQIKIGSNATFGGQGVTQIANPASANLYALAIGGSFGDNGTISENIITDDTVVVTATVQQTITFSISTTTLYFGNFSSVAARYASSTNAAGDSLENIANSLVVSTNASGGYTISVRGQTLTSQQFATSTISFIGAAPAPSLTGSEQFGIRATVSGGTGASIAATYASTTAYGYSGTATTSSTLATGSGATNASTYSLRYLGNISATTEAGTYVANLVYVATSNF